MRRLFTVQEANERGLTRAALRWGVRAGRWHPIDQGVYLVGADDPTPLERAAAAAPRHRRVASGTVAGVLLGLDSVALRGPDVTVAPTSSGRREDVRRRALPPGRVTVLDGVSCTDGLQTLLDLAAVLDDDAWEQALESALRRHIGPCDRAALAGMGESRTPGVRRIRRVLARRPPRTAHREPARDPHGPTRPVGTGVG